MQAADRYLEIARELVPTPEQTSRFAHFVSDARSWYKQLSPLPPGQHFIVYLDPYAGMRRYPGTDGQVAFAEISPDEIPSHYSILPTAEYRERFGHWQFAAEPFVADFEDDESAPSVVDPLGDEIQLPRALASAGSCYLTAHVHRLMPMPPRDLASDAIESFDYFAGEAVDLAEFELYRPLATELRAWVKGEPVDAERIKQFHHAERPRQLALLQAALDRFIVRLRPAERVVSTSCSCA